MGIYTGLEEENMIRKDFLERLEVLLEGISEEERKEALQYYSDYFEDAGEKMEGAVIRELGSPEEVAAKILADSDGKYGEYSEQGFEDTRFEGKQKLMTGTNVEHGWEDISEEEPEKRKKQPQNIWKTIVITVLFCLTAPILLSLGMAGLAVIAAVVIAVIAVLLGIGVSGAAIFVAGLAVLIAGIIKAALYPASGILAAGIGFLLIAAGILVSLGILWLAVKFLPILIRAIVKLLKIPFRKAGERG